MFCYSLTHLSPGRVYQELGDGQVLEAMEKHLHHYFTHCAIENEDDPSSSQDRSSPALDLVLFRSAVEHAARLCRVLVRQNTHQQNHVIIEIVIVWSPAIQ